MVRMRSPVRIWPAAPKSAWSHVGLGAFSSYRIAFRTGDLTGEACLNKTRRPPKAVTASSNLASSSTSEQSPLCSGVFLCLWQKSHRPPAPLLLLPNPNPLARKGHAASVRRRSRQRLRRRWASGLFFGKTKGEPDAFSSCRGVFRTGELTGEACFNKDRRPRL